MKKGIALAGAAGAGAALMYLFDPDRGKRRRALVRNKMIHAVNKTGDVAARTKRDVRNRVQGVLSEARAIFRSDKVTDEVLVARVRSKMGRVGSHPSAIKVKADKGSVTLAGPVLASEANRLLKCVAAVRGVAAVENQLEIHEQASDLPGPQGGRAR